MRCTRTISTRNALDLRHAGKNPPYRREPILGHRADETRSTNPFDGSAIEAIRERLVDEAQQIRLEDIAINEAIGRNGAALVPDGKTVLTHCNAGALATAGFGTALGVIRAAVACREKDRRVRR